MSANKLQAEQILHSATSSTPLNDVLIRATEDLERLSRIWQASTYLWPTRAEHVQHGTLVRPSSHSARFSGHWKSVAQIENFSRTADRLAATMRQANRLDLATLYEARAAQARQRAALLTSLLSTIELAYAAIESYRSQIGQSAGPDARMLEPMDGAATRADSVASVQLTPREQQVAALIALGYSNRQIADELVISRGTAANHVSSILGKLGCRNRTEVAVTIYGFTENGVHESGPPPVNGRHS